MVAAAIVEVVRLRQARPSGARRSLVAESASCARIVTCEQRSRSTMSSPRPLALQGQANPQYPFSGPCAECQEHSMRQLFQAPNLYVTYPSPILNGW
jgi:hypothetical protein